MLLYISWLTLVPWNSSDVISRYLGPQIPRWVARYVRANQLLYHI